MPSTLVLLIAVVIVLELCKVESKISQLVRQQATYYSSFMDTTVCKSTPGLSKSQIELCYQQPDATMAAFQGLNHAVKECQYQFQGHRWNCSSLATRGKNPYISTFLQKGYKEAAFSHAITSAGVAIAIARSCSSGVLTNCGCDSKVYKKGKTRSMTNSMDKTSWKWGGCSHNIRYGIKFSKLFLDAREKAEDIQSKIALHNNQVGRTVVSNNMQVKCKCHGMSGSCELKTCWRAAPDFRIIGKALKERFRAAIIVDQTNKPSKKKNIRRFNEINQKKRKQNLRGKQWTPMKNKHKRDLSYDLLYYQKSPNFCDKELSVDVLGTSGRLCNRTNFGSDSCSNLCCGRGYNLIKNKRVERCNCQFVWCCQVECDTCTYEDWISVCK